MFKYIFTFSLLLFFSSPANCASIYSGRLSVCAAFLRQLEFAPKPNEVREVKNAMLDLYEDLKDDDRFFDVLKTFLPVRNIAYKTVYAGKVIWGRDDVMALAEKVQSEEDTLSNELGNIDKIGKWYFPIQDVFGVLGIINIPLSLYLLSHPQIIPHNWGWELVLGVGSSAFLPYLGANRMPLLDRKAKGLVETLLSISSDKEKKFYIFSTNFSVPASWLTYLWEEDLKVVASKTLPAFAYDKSALGPKFFLRLGDFYSRHRYIPKEFRKATAWNNLNLLVLVDNISGTPRVISVLTRK